MSNGQQGVSIDQLSREDLVKIVQRGENVKRDLSARLGAMMVEATELYQVINELQQALNEANARPSLLDGNGSQG